MKKVISGCFTFLLCFSFIKGIKAASTCDYSEQVELQNIAASIKATYEAGWRKTDEFVDIDTAIEDADGAYIDEIFVDVTILNITDQVYLTIENNKSTEKKTYYYSDTENGILHFSKENVYEIVEYKIQVFSNHEHCQGDLLRTITLLTPMYNDYSDYGYCNSLPNLFYCQEFITSEITGSVVDVTAEMSRQYDLLQKTEEVHETKELSFWEKIGQFIKEHILIIAIVLGLIILLGVAATVVAFRKRRSRVL